MIAGDYIINKYDRGGDMYLIISCEDSTSEYHSHFTVKNIRTQRIVSESYLYGFWEKIPVNELRSMKLERILDDK